MAWAWTPAFSFQEMVSPAGRFDVPAGDDADTFAQEPLYGLQVLDGLSDGQVGEGLTFSPGRAQAQGIVATDFVKTPVRSPRANAFAERWVRTVREDCLDHLHVLSRRHLEVILEEYIEHYNCARPHRGVQLTPPEIACRARKDPLTRRRRWTHPRVRSRRLVDRLTCRFCSDAYDIQLRLLA